MAALAPRRRTWRRWVGRGDAATYFLAGTLVLLGAVLWGVKTQSYVLCPGSVTVDHNMVFLHAATSGLVVDVVASVGDHIDKDRPLLFLDPNLSSEALAELERRLASQKEDEQRLESTLATLGLVLSAPDGSHGEALAKIGVSAETFNLVNDLTTARLELDSATEYRRAIANRQKNQIASEIALVERNIELLRRNLENSRKASAERDAALKSKRQDFAALMKLADKGLVSATDVNRERDLLLQAELAATENRKQMDQVEIDISNRTLQISQLQVQSESVGEEANNRYNTAKLRYDLRMARLADHKEALARQLRVLQNSSQSQQDTAQQNDQNTGIIALRAPVSGVIVQLRTPSPGDSVRAGDQVATMQPDGAKPVVLAHVPQGHIHEIVPGMRARVRLDSYSEAHFGGLDAVVLSVFADPDKPEFLTKLAVVTSTLDKSGIRALLVPGLSVHVDIFTRERPLLDVWMHP